MGGLFSSVFSKPTMYYNKLYNRMMRSSTWSKDSHGLFDYESNNIVNGEFKIMNSSRIIRKELVVEIKETREDLDQTLGPIYKSLANIGILKDKHWVYDPYADFMDDHHDPILLLLRNYVDENGQPGIKLCQGDIVKMGRCRYLVKEIVGELISPADIKLEMGEDCKANKYCEKIPNVNIRKEEKNDDDIRCRICLGNESTEENPLICSPCSCAGSVKYIHCYCMQQWLKSKITERKTESVISYTWKQFQCDICKSFYPSTIYIILDEILCPNGKSMEIFSIEKPASNYMVLETISSTDLSIANNTYIIKSNNKDTLRIVI